MKNQMAIAAINAATKLLNRIEYGLVGYGYPIEMPALFDSVYNPKLACEKWDFAIGIIVSAMEAMNMPIIGMEAEDFFYDYRFHGKTIEEAYASIVHVREEYALLAI